MALEHTIEEHKVAFGVLGAAALILFVLLLRRGSGSGSANPTANLLGYQSQQNELNAQYSLQSQQIAAQQDAADQTARAQNAQVNAAANAQNTSTEASLIANLYDTLKGSQVSEDQLGAEESVTNTQTAAELAAAERQYDSSDYQAGLTAQLYGQGLTESSALDMAELQDQYNQNQTILSAVKAAGLNHGTESLENSLTGIIAEVEGEPAVGVAEANANAVGSQASAFQNASIWNSIANLGKSTVSAVFA